MTSAQYKVHRTIHFEVAISVLEIHVKFTSVMDWTWQRPGAKAVGE